MGSQGKNAEVVCHSLLQAQMVKRLPAMQDTWVRSLDLEDSLEKEMTTHSSSLAWKTPWTEDPVRHDWATSIFSSGPYLSELSTMTHPSWVALHSMAHSFVELDKAVVHVIRLVHFCNCGFQSVCPLMEKDKKLMKASWWERLTKGNWVLCWRAGPCSVNL